MKRTLKSILKFAGVVMLLLMPVIVEANQVQSGLNNSGLSSLFGGGLSGSTSATQLIRNVINLLLLFAGSVAVIFLIIGGYQYVSSAGNDEAAEKGKKTLVNAIIGIVIIVLSFAIINVIANFVSGRT